MSYSTSVTTRPSFRDSVANKLVAIGKPIHTIMRYRRKPWNISKKELSEYPENSLGQQLYQFLEQNEFELMPRIEFHDVYHVLFQLGTTMREETNIQFVVIGNGKRSLPNLIATVVCVVFYPEYWNEFRKAYQRGRNAKKFYDLKFIELLDRDLDELQGELNLR